MELLAIILIIAIVIGFEALVFKKYVLTGIEYTVNVNKNKVYEGEYIELTEVLKNNKLIGLPWVKTELSASKWLAFLRKDSVVQTSNSENVFIPGVFSLKPRKMCTRVRRIKCIKRGVFSFDNTIVTATDILGIIKVTKSIPVNISVTVLPVSADGDDAILSINEPIGEISVKRYINDDPFIISGSKEYTGREPINRIYWNYTAARNSLMVYNNEYTTSHNILLIMNMQRRSSLPVVCITNRDLEAYIKLSVRLAENSISNGNAVTFVTNGGKFDGVISDTIKDYEHFNSLLLQLALLDSFCEYDFSDMITNSEFKAFTDIILITNYIDKEIIEFSEKIKISDKNLIIYTNDEEVESIQTFQRLPLNRFSFKWNLDE